ncbi:MAG: hypothetical protein KatS3mg111_1281 [Pirellulaceae bacterium]|nr:MAG: hypothetical protein KatS3mg111_1281 [Pirellulaceae bacterium]
MADGIERFDQSAGPRINDERKRLPLLPLVLPSRYLPWNAKTVTSRIDVLCH